MTCKLIQKIFSVQRRLAGRTDRGAGQHKITSRAALYSKFLRSRGPNKITSRAAFGPRAAGCTGLMYRTNVRERRWSARSTVDCTRPDGETVRRKPMKHSSLACVGRLSDWPLSAASTSRSNLRRIGFAADEKGSDEIRGYYAGQQRPGSYSVYPY